CDDVHQLRAGPDDAGLLGLFADHEAVYILQKEQGSARLIAIHDEAGGFVGAIDVDHAAVLQRALSRLAPLPLIGDDADGPTTEPTRAAHERLAILSLVLVERRVIEN